MKEARQLRRPYLRAIRIFVGAGSGFMGRPDVGIIQSLRPLKVLHSCKFEAIGLCCVASG
jgi:hypothetical protein